MKSIINEPIKKTQAKFHPKGKQKVKQSKHPRVDTLAFWNRGLDEKKQISRCEWNCPAKPKSNRKARRAKLHKT